MLQVGQVLYFVPSFTRTRPYEVIVEKIGRKWASTSDRGRIDIVTLEADGRGYASPGRAYLSKADYDTERDLDGAWSNLRVAMRDKYRPPDGVTIEQITAAMALLGLKAD